MATLTKSTGTVTLSGAAEKVTLTASYGWVWVKNMSEGDIFAGLSADISVGADGVLTIPSGECGRIQTDGFLSVYLLGSGNVQIVGQNYADCPFKVGGKGGESPDLSLYAKKTDIPTELPANGGNADTVDGKHASDFKAYQRYVPNYNGDLLDMTEMGTYSCRVSDVTNVPSSIAEWCYVTMIQFHDAGYRRYICVPLNNATTSANELYLAIEYMRDSEGKLIWRNISDGGTAKTLSEWGTRVFSDLNDAELGFSASCSDAGHLNAPNSFWSTVLTTGSNTAENYKSQLALPWSAASNTQKLKYRTMDNGDWYDWIEIYTSVNKPYVTGIATIAAGGNTCITNHGFTPSAVLWWENSGGREIRSASSFDTTSFNPSVIDTSERVLNYIIFK